MRIRVLGGGFYGCHVALHMRWLGHEVELHEIRDGIFKGASGSIPARIHQGFHYPRSRLTRAACLEHSEAFMGEYGRFTRGVPVNIYAIAADRSLVDFDQYVRTLENEIPFIPIYDPEEYGLRNVEGAVLTGERHIVTDDVRTYFEDMLGPYLRLNTPPGEIDSKEWDFTIDCTFCANDGAGVDRYEPCLVVLLKGPTDTAITVMDGPFGSLYPWNETLGLSSLSSAKWTPFSKSCKTWAAANDLLHTLHQRELMDQARGMIDDMLHFYPSLMNKREIAELRTSIRAMPLSGADTRLVDVRKVGERVLRVRAGKIDAVIHAAETIEEMIG